jgi:hypothetical protein
MLDGLVTLTGDLQNPVTGIVRHEFALLPPARIEAGRAFSLRLPLPLVAGDRGIMQVAMVDGRPLPAWLQIDPVAGTIEGVAPRDFDGTMLQLTVREPQGHVRSMTLELSASTREGAKAAHEPRSKPDHATSRSAVTAKPALHAQFGQQRQSGQVDHAALLHQLAVARQHHVSMGARP